MNFLSTDTLLIALWGNTDLKLFINLQEGEPTGIFSRLLLGDGRGQDLSNKEGRDAEE